MTPDAGGSGAEAATVAKRKRLKWWMLLPLAAVLAGVLAYAFLPGLKGSGPEGTVRDAMAAMEQMDAQLLADHFVESSRLEVVGAMNDAFAMVDRISVSNLKTSVLSESGSTAVVQLEFDSRVTAFGETQSEHMTDEVELRKVGGQWLLEKLVEF